MINLIAVLNLAGVATQRLQAYSKPLTDELSRDGLGVTHKAVWGLCDGSPLHRFY